MNKRNLRIVLSFLVIAVALSICGCALTDTVTAYSLYSNAMKKLDKAGGFETDCTIDINFNIMDESIASSIDMNIKKNGDTVRTAMSIGEEETFTTFVDNKVYVEYDDIKLRYTVPEEKKDSVSANLGSSGIPKLTKEKLDGIAVTRYDGKTTISLELDEESAHSLMGAALDNELVKLESVIMSIDFDKKGNIETITLECGTSASVIGMEFDGDMTFEYRFINFGTAPEIQIDFNDDDYEDAGEYLG